MPDTNDSDKSNDWLIGPIGSCINFLCDELAFLGTVTRAFSSITLIPSLLQIVGSLQISDEQKLRLSQFSKLMAEPVELTERYMIGGGMRGAYQSVAVSLWGGLETTIEETLLNCVLNVPTVEQIVRSAYPKILPMSVTDVGSAREFVIAWERRLLTTDVVTRAIEMLAVAGLIVNVTDQQRRTLAELSEFRNLAVHRRGIVDARFKTKVPWCALGVGDTFPIDHSVVGQFFDACNAFAQSLLKAATESPLLVRR